ncbi:hypothetical protein CI15_34040 [Paraburkholderia monticola]|uniref:Uncharacterized protein n=1 Tax=Paraburkholderia monticola TaxID=1399968 RepID=A0A149PBZ5_9BURK|nr:polysaccharide biosynthesis C-terminal domain-containing protein [Paraburkholderia monticola]KXU82542.1 hypothetical protein CI15_34040 [Paraburkholderia monticola]
MTALDRAAKQVSALAIAGQAVAYLLAVILARRLGVEGFKVYVVASSTFIVLVMLAPRGFDKFTLRLLPVLLDKGDWQRARGYLRFGAWRTVWSAVCLAGVAGLWAGFADGLQGQTRLALIVSCAFVPIGAFVHLAQEVLTALGRGLAATAIFRLVVPCLVLATLGVLFAVRLPVSGAVAVGCWGVAWVVALAIMLKLVRRHTPPQVWQATALEDAQTWEADARPFWIYRMSMAVLGQAGVIVLDWLQPSAGAVGAYAVAMGVAGIAQVLATATNRLYAGQLAILLEQRNVDAIQSLRRKRLRWLAAPLVAYLALAFGLTRELLALFRPEFADEGLVALRLLALTAAFVVLVAMAPTYLKYRAQHRVLYASVAAAACVQVVLLLLLVPRMGATGAALAYAIAMGGLYGNLARIARRELRRMRIHGAPQAG